MAEINTTRKYIVYFHGEYEEMPQVVQAYTYDCKGGQFTFVTQSGIPVASFSTDRVSQVMSATPEDIELLEAHDQIDDTYIFPAFVAGGVVAAFITFLIFHHII